MPPRSKLQQLTDEQRSELHRLIDQGVAFIDIEERMRELGVETSKSAVHRYAKNDYEPMAKLMRYSREMAKHLSPELEETEGDGSRLLIETLQSLCLELIAKMSSAEEVDPKEVSRIVGMVRDLSFARKANVDTDLRLRKEVAQQAADAAVEVATAQGLTKDTVSLIKARILGVAS